MSNVKNAAKTVDKEMRRLGATRSSNRDGVQYTLPDGSRMFVPSNIRWTAAHGTMDAARRRMGVAPERPALNGDRVSINEAPVVDLERIVVTPHARQRRQQMGSQDNLTTLEVATALTCPMRVLWMPKHNTHAWVGDRVAVVGHVREGVLTIRTFLWTTNELWARNPRPEQELLT